MHVLSAEPQLSDLHCKSGYLQYIERRKWWMAGAALDSRFYLKLSSSLAKELHYGILYMYTPTLTIYRLYMIMNIYIHKEHVLHRHMTIREMRASIS